MSSLFVFDGMKRPSFTVKVDVEHATVADLFSKVAESYELKFNARRNLRIIFVDKELKYTRKEKLCDVGIINHSTVAVIFQLPDRHPTAPATKADADVVESVEVKIDEENKDEGEVSVAEFVPVKAKKKTKKKKRKNSKGGKNAKGGRVLENVADTMTVMTDEENKDVKEVSPAESEPVKTDEENKDAKEVKTGEENKDAKEVKTGEENKDANDICVAEHESMKKGEDAKDAREVKTDEENKDAKEVSAAESEPVKTGEENKDAKQVKTGKKSKDANDICVAEHEPMKKGEDAKDAREVKTDEESKDLYANEVSVAESEPVKEDEDAKDAKEVSTAESEPVDANEENKDENEVSVARKSGEVVPVLEETVIECKNAVNAPMPTTMVSNITAAICTAGRVEKEEKRPVLQCVPGFIELSFLPDFLNFDFDMKEARAILPCCHVMGSKTMRKYCQKLIDTGNTKFTCPYPLFPFSLHCPAVWDYRLVRHVACFTTKEMHNTEKTIAINFAGKDSSTLACPGCFTWCSKVDPKQTRMRCFLCTRETGKEFLFCGYCLREWKNARSGKCANPMCKSVEKTLDILRNSPVTNLYGGTWPTIRLCPRCGILTEFMGQCSQVHCQLCGYDYCFLCLKGAKSKDELRCIPYNSPCQRAPLQTSIPQWDGQNSD